MGIEQCIADAVAAGKMSARGAEEYKARMRDAEALAEQRGLAGPAQYLFAVEEAAKAMEARATGKRAQVQQTILAIDRAWEGARQNSKGIGYGLTDVLGERLHGEGSGHSIGQQQRGNLAAVQSIMADTLAKLQSRAFGLQQERILPRHLIYELYGVDTGNPAAKAAAKAWTDGMEWIRDEFARAGVFIRERDDWRTTQHFDHGAVKALGKEGFTAQMEQWWRDGGLRLRDWQADGQAYLVPGRADDRAREIFERAYDNITTGGDASIEPGAVRSATMADRYGRRRAFEWATPDSWLEFNRTLGGGDDAIGELHIRHMDRMTRDLAVAQVLGPDPDKAAKILIDMYRKETAGRFGANYWANRLQAMYEINAGQANMPVSQALAMGAQSFRQFLASAQLGGAVLSSPSDFGFTRSTAAWHGLDMSKVMSAYLSNLKPSSAADRAQAMRDGLILEVGLRGLGDAARDVIGDVAGAKGMGGKTDAALNGLSRVTGRMSEFVIRAQGLAHHTQALRDAVGSTLLAHLGDLAPRRWGDLSPVDRRLFDSYGMGPKDWDTIRSAALDRGFLDVARLAREGSAAERTAAVKMLGAVAGIQRMAVPEGNTITRALMLGGTRPGTPEGEFLRSLTQYKGFPMSAMLMHGFRALEAFQGEQGIARGRYIAGLVAMTTVLGAASLQLKAIAAGKDPQPMYGEHAAQFWLNAAAQGGALGILGDHVKAMFSAQRLDDASRVLSPGAGFLLDASELAFGRIQDAANDHESHTGRQAVKMLRKYTPGVWYTRLAMDRLVNDTVQRMADPDYAEAFNRIEERARREQGTQFWWRPGYTVPDRAPDLGRAVGAAP